MSMMCSKGGAFWSLKYLGHSSSLMSDIHNSKISNTSLLCIHFAFLLTQMRSLNGSDHQSCRNQSQTGRWEVNSQTPHTQLVLPGCQSAVPAFTENRVQHMLLPPWLTLQQIGPDSLLGPPLLPQLWFTRWCANMPSICPRQKKKKICYVRKSATWRTLECAAQIGRVNTQEEKIVTCP